MTAEEIDFMEQPYVAYGLVGPKSCPGEKPLAGTTNVKLKKLSSTSASSRNASCKPKLTCRRPQRNKAATNYEAEIACSLPQARI